MWVRKVMDLMINLTHEVWKNRCEHVNTTLNMSYESRLRNKCMTLWIDLQSKKKDIPLLYRHLLNKEQCFFKNATVSALKSWIRRIQLATKTLEKKHQNHDIRKWIVSVNSRNPNGNSTVNINSTNDSVSKNIINEKSTNTWSIENGSNDLLDVDLETTVRTPFIHWQT